MEFALKNGCQASRVSIYNGSSSSFEIRDMKMDRLQQASENSLVIHLFVDGRFGSFSTNRLDKKELESFIRNGIAYHSLPGGRQGAYVTRLFSLL